MNNSLYIDEMIQWCEKRAQKDPPKIEDLMENMYDGGNHDDTFWAGYSRGEHDAAKFMLEKLLAIKGEI